MKVIFNIKHIMILSLLALSLGLSACSKMQFSNANQMSEAPSNSGSSWDVPPGVTPPVPADPAPADPTPVTPAPVTPSPAPAPSYNKSAGDCANDSSTNVTSCMKCQVPTVVAPEPLLSKKAANLLDIMTLACQVHNKWDPAGYVAPTRRQILARVSRCGDGIYPQSTMTTSQKKTIAALLDPNNDAMRVKLFSEYFMQPPQSDDFETYFGMNGQEVRQMYCYGQTAPTNDLYAPQYYQSITTPWDAGMPVAYKLGNVYRNQLKTCMHESDVNPWNPAPVVAKKCQYEQMSGPNGSAITQQIQAWLDAGYSIGIDIKNQGMCSSVTSANQFANAQGDVTIGAYHCQ